MLAQRAVSWRCLQPYLPPLSLSPLVCRERCAPLKRARVTLSNAAPVAPLALPPHLASSSSSSSISPSSASGSAQQVQVLEQLWGGGSSYNKGGQEGEGVAHPASPLAFKAAEGVRRCAALVRPRGRALKAAAVVPVC